MTLIEVLVALIIITTVLANVSAFLYPAQWSRSAIRRMSDDSLLESEMWRVMRQRPAPGFEKVVNLDGSGVLRVVVVAGGAGKLVQGSVQRKDRRIVMKAGYP